MIKLTYVMTSNTAIQLNLTLIENIIEQHLNNNNIIIDDNNNYASLMCYYNSTDTTNYYAMGWQIISITRYNTFYTEPNIENNKLITLLTKQKLNYITTQQKINKITDIRKYLSEKFYKMEINHLNYKQYLENLLNIRIDINRYFPFSLDNVIYLLSALTRYSCHEVHERYINSKKISLYATTLIIYGEIKYVIENINKIKNAVMLLLLVTPFK